MREPGVGSGAAHGGPAMTTPGDLPMATLAEDRCSSAAAIASLTGTITPGPLRMRDRSTGGRTECAAKRTESRDLLAQDLLTFVLIRGLGQHELSERVANVRQVSQVSAPRLSRFAVLSEHQIYAREASTSVCVGVTEGPKPLTDLSIRVCSSRDPTNERPDPDSRGREVVGCLGHTVAEPMKLVPALERALNEVRRKRTQERAQSQGGDSRHGLSLRCSRQAFPGNALGNQHRRTGAKRARGAPVENAT
jgi:hypothetical protein